MRWMTKVLWAKKAIAEAGDLWLPLHGHMSDSAEAARFVWNSWVPEGTKKLIAAGISSPANGDADEDFAQQAYTFLAAAHDLGKATPVFQSKEQPISCRLDTLLHRSIRDAGLRLEPHTAYSERMASHHSIASHAILKRCGFQESIAVVLGAHHGKPPSYGQLQHIQAYAKNIGFDDELWLKVQEELLDCALNHAGITKSLAQSISVTKPAQVLLSGLVILVDWISSDEKLFPLIELHENSIRSKERAKNAEIALNLTPNWSTDRDWNQLYKRRFEIEHPRAIQEEVIQVIKNCIKPGILVVEAPMGEGKTEAALAAAEVMATAAGRGGIYFALPTQATSDAMLGRICDWIEHLDQYGGKHSILLAHGKADFNQEYRKIKLSEQTCVGETEGETGESVIVHEWLSGRKKSILADFVVGTIDHVLMAGLKQKHVMLRHLGLANKVIIVDECHAYDAYMSQYLKTVMKWLGVYGVPVIVLSATLPSHTRKGLIEAYLDRKDVREFDPLFDSETPAQVTPEWARSREYPLITYTDGREIHQKSVVGSARSLTVALQHISDDCVSATLEKVLPDGGCVGVIVNTVKRAQSIYQDLAARFGKDCVYLVHSRFISSDRATKEEELRRLLGPPHSAAARPNRCIVIGTQVLEQSLDIDFDLLITDICPMDLLIQRMGRLHRHDRIRPIILKDPLCLVLGSTESGIEPGAEAIYGKYLLMKTRALLPETIRLPEAIAPLVQDTYSENEDVIQMDPSLRAEYEAAKQAQRKRISDKESRAKAFQVSDPGKRSLQTIVGWLDTAIQDPTGKRGEATVRDAADSIEVIVVQKAAGNELRFLPWVEFYGSERIPRESEPDDAMARALVGCSIRLPSIFGARWMIDKAVAELENWCRDEGIVFWQKSRWLKGELFLFLDEQFKADLCGYHLKYDRHLGLTMEKTEG